MASLGAPDRAHHLPSCGDGGKAEKTEKESIRCFRDVSVLLGEVPGGQVIAVLIACQLLASGETG